jgi:hypothetical protein
MQNGIDVNQALGGMNAFVETVQQLARDSQHLLQTVNKLTEENTRLRAELAAARAERDEYETALRFQSRRETAITAEDLRDMEQSGFGAKELLDIINELGQSPDASRP